MMPAGVDKCKVMLMDRGVVLLLLLFNFKWISAQDECSPAPPSYGDVRLTPSGLVLIYMGPDGNDIGVNNWGTLDGFNSGPNVGDTLCQQLGYDDGSVTLEQTSESDLYPVWLWDIQCPDHQPKHILRCSHFLNSPGIAPSAMDHSHDIHLTCSSYSTRAEYSTNAYVGQPALLPPIDGLMCNRSRSWGVITIKRNEKRWHYIRNDSNLLTSDDTDTICREMGYTHSVHNSLLTVRSSGYSHYYLFQFNIFGNTNTSQFSCLRSCQCIGCCLNMTSRNSDDVVIINSLDPVTSDPDALIVRCSFYTPVDSTALVTGGYKGICEASTKNGTIKNEAVCPRMTNNVITLTDRQFAATIAAPVSVGILVSIAAFVVACMCVYFKSKRQRNEYGQVRGEGE